MRIYSLLFCVIICCLAGRTQTSGSFVVRGDLDKFYPVTFSDYHAWQDNVPTQLSIGRSDVHVDASWRGSIIATFKFHTTNWGHQSHFIDAEISSYNSFVAGWKDITTSNATSRVVIWLKGGNTTYTYKSNYPQGPVVYDNVQNPLPLQEPPFSSHTYKTAIDANVNQAGHSLERTLYLNGSGGNFINGQLGIGALPGAYKLSVNGDAIFTRIKIKSLPWADYVFDPGYRLTPLSEVEAFIKTNRHLPEVPTAKEVEANGLDLGPNQALLLKKIEELTLYLIDQNKEIEKMKVEMDSIRKQVSECEEGEEKRKRTGSKGPALQRH